VRERFVPRILSWNTTNRCNLKCAHCYMDALDREGPSELSTEEGMRLIDDIASLSKCILVLSGGEPLLREDICELARHARSRGLRVVMGTNGTLITEAKARDLISSGVARVAISLDGCDAAVHDSLRGVEGAFEAAVQGARACSRAGLEFQVNATVTPANFRSIPEMIGRAKDLGAAEFHLFFLVPTGRGTHLKDITPSEYEEMLTRLLTLEDEVGMRIKPTCAPMYMRVSKQKGGKAQERYTRGCLAGLTYCRISPEGGVYPCPYLPIQVGSVRERSFSEVWADAPFFQQLRDFASLKGKCGRCEFVDVCGGCRARAFALTGDPLKPDPWCVYVPGEVRQ
jgi:radical SAM protein with 4Fe4S-binding SPASM domain